ncbi:hypothetical protein Trydic_g8943 [Trypoxylus dichotomus]
MIVKELSGIPKKKRTKNESEIRIRKEEVIEYKKSNYGIYFGKASVFRRIPVFLLTTNTIYNNAHDGLANRFRFHRGESRIYQEISGCPRHKQCDCEEAGLRTAVSSLCLQRRRPCTCTQDT